jgi:hypothetical protein
MPTGSLSGLNNGLIHAVEYHSDLFSGRTKDMGMYNSIRCRESVSMLCSSDPDSSFYRTTRRKCFNWRNLIFLRHKLFLWRDIHYNREIQEKDFTHPKPRALDNERIEWRRESVRGVIRIKCARQKNFRMYHFKNSIISGLFWPSHSMKVTSQQFIQCQMAAAHSSLKGVSHQIFRVVFIMYG